MNSLVDLNILFELYHNDKDAFKKLIDIAVMDLCMKKIQFDNIHFESEWHKTHQIICMLIVEILKTKDQNSIDNICKIIYEKNLTNIDTKTVESFAEYILNGIKSLGPMIIKRQDLEKPFYIQNDQIVDVEWRLDYNIQCSGNVISRTPVFFVRFKYLRAGELMLGDIFTCSEEMLMDIVSKLEDAKQQALNLHSRLCI